VSDDPTLWTFPDLPDEAVIALHDFLELFTIGFQNHYFTQLRRAYYDPPSATCDPRQPPSACDPDPQILPLDDPPF
jgi:hypothetical protein